MVIIINHAPARPVQKFSLPRVFCRRRVLPLFHAKDAPVRIIIHEIRKIGSVELHCNHLEKGILLLPGKGFPDMVHLLKYFLIAVNPARRLVPVSRLGKGVHIHLLHLPCVCELVKGKKTGGKLLSEAAAEGIINPFLQKKLLVICQGILSARLPCKSRIEGNLLLQRLYRAEIRHPDFPNPLLIRL